MKPENLDDIIESSKHLNSVQVNSKLNNQIMAAFDDIQKPSQMNVFLKLAAMIVLALNISVISINLSTDSVQNSSKNTTLERYFNLSTTDIYTSEVQND